MIILIHLFIDVSEFKDLVDKFIQIVFKISSSVEEAKIKVGSDVD